MTPNLSTITAEAIKDFDEQFCCHCSEGCTNLNEGYDTANEAKTFITELAENVAKAAIESVIEVLDYDAILADAEGPMDAISRNARYGERCKRTMKENVAAAAQAFLNDTGV